MRWDRLTLGMALGFALLAWSMGFGAVLPALRDEVDMSSAVAALHASLFGICLLVFAIFGSRFFASIPNRSILAISFAGMLAGGLLFGLGRSAVITVTGAGLAGAGGALFVIVVPAIVYAHHAKDSTRVVATLNSFPMASGTLLPLSVGLAVAVGFSWRFSYLAPLVAIAIGMAFCVVGSRVTDDRQGQPVGLSHIFRLPELGRRWFAMVCGVLAEIGTGVWAASIMREQGGASKGTAASLTVGFFVGMAAGRLSLSSVLRRFAPHRILMFCFSGSVVACVPFLLGPGLVGRVVGLTLLGLMIAVIYPLSVARMFELSDDTAALGRAAAVASGLGVTFGPLLLGALSDLVGLGLATVILPVFLLAGLVTVLRPQPA